MNTEPVALDIETTGLGPRDTITCIAIAGKNWGLTWTMGPGYNHEETKVAVASQLEGASRIYTYNGASFDIPFLQRFFCYTDEEIGQWMQKLVDPLYAARALLGYEACPRLSEVLRLNEIDEKTSSGAEAVKMAAEGRWDDLAAYCAQDTVVTYKLLERECIYWTKGLAFAKSSKYLWQRICT